MRVLHFDCFNGISGDMALAALLDVGADRAAVEAGLASLSLPIALTVEADRRGGIAGTRIVIQAPPEQPQRYLPQIETLLSSGKLAPAALELAVRIFRRLADAEAKVHGIAVDRVHFHEVGALDSIADIAGVAIAFTSLKVERVTSGPVPTGHGTVECDHGTMPIPAPATALLLQGVPLAPVDLASELTTPTGAAILMALVQEYTPTPAMIVSKIGHGCGTKDFPRRANVLRVWLGESVVQTRNIETIWVLETTLDNVPGEVIGYAFEQLFEAGAVDAYLTPVQMKKQRPGVVVTCLVADENLLACEGVLFRETGTLGVRRTKAERTTLNRDSVTVNTRFGRVHIKRGWDDKGLATVSPEFADCQRIAREHGVPLRAVTAAAQLAAASLPPPGKGTP